ncbi:allatostatin-A receptor-like [Dendronephthya gigantea]|uniref:allatostatin-A receptor-like n=1 Tax=Dendronephthya gigantea TaxID=151771 RepID=UPI00106B6549|nr:allatostatin-A receptor-like [Dendronephthya gigantea]
MQHEKVILAIIAIVASLGNTLTVLLFIKNPTWLRKTYNCLIFALAIQDILQAVCIMILPGYILHENVYTLPSDATSRWVFCKIFWSEYFIFTLGITSVYTCLMLTFDRFLAVVMPLSYKKYEQSKIVVFLTVLFPWIAGMCLEVTTPLRATAIDVNGTAKCSWKTQEYSSKNVLVATFTFLGMVIVPGILMVIAYRRIIVHMRRSQRRVATIRNNKEKARQTIALKSLRKVTRTAFLASNVIIVCWLPDQLYYALSLVNLTELGTTTHFIVKSIAFVNSCLNPFREGLRELFGCLCCKAQGELRKSDSNYTQICGIATAIRQNLPKVNH